MKSKIVKIVKIGRQRVPIVFYPKGWWHDDSMAGYGSEYSDHLHRTVNGAVKEVKSALRKPKTSKVLHGAAAAAAAGRVKRDSKGRIVRVR